MITAGTRNNVAAPGGSAGLLLMVHDVRRVGVPLHRCFCFQDIGAMPVSISHGYAAVHRAHERAEIAAHAFFFDDSRHVNAHSVCVVFAVGAVGDV